MGAKPKLVGLTFRQISHNKQERNEKVFDFLVTKFIVPRHVVNG